MRAPASGTYLDGIVSYHRQAAALDARSLVALLDQARAAPALRPFAEALTAASAGADGHVALIAEVKRRSPSRGDLAPGLVAACLARSYEAGGAACLSVLTDGPSFGGSAADLAEARDACSLPVLRKDFTVDERDVADARIMGADAVLLIVAALDDAELAAFRALAAELGMTAVVEVHTEGELDRALAAGATVVGVNARDLATFAVDRTLAARLVRAIPAGIVRVAESGVRDREDVARLGAAGFHAVLVGETLVTSADPAAAAAALLGRRES